MSLPPKIDCCRVNRFRGNCESTSHHHHSCFLSREAFEYDHLLPKPSNSNGTVGQLPRLKATSELEGGRFVPPLSPPLGDMSIPEHKEPQDPEKREARSEDSGEKGVTIIYNAHVDVSGIDEAKLVRKLDWRLIPWLSFLYLLSFLDRTSIGNARVHSVTDPFVLGQP